MMGEDKSPKPRALIACPGLDHAVRGFETLARECFHALRSEASLDVNLVKGSGDSAAGELVARTARRESATARALARMMPRRRYAAYDVEQAVFTAAMLPHLRRLRPHVVFVSDWLTSRALAGTRRYMHRPFSLVVSNGGPWPPEVLRHADHVQELTPAALDTALESDTRERHTLLPLGVAMPPRPMVAAETERYRLRRILGLTEHRRVVLSVGALNMHHKRLDYLIEEFAALPPPRPLLVLLGAKEAETPAVRSLAADLVGPSGCLIRTVPSAQVADYYRAADMFVLASLVEAFGRVLVEALSHGLPCLAHDGPVQRYVLGPHGHFADLRERGSLTRLLSALGGRELAPGAAWERHRFVRERFSWDALAPRYAELLRRCAARP
jgi:1,2-diacylglycerol 3-alpha-glucosyltransferase